MTLFNMRFVSVEGCKIWKESLLHFSYKIGTRRHGDAEFDLLCGLACLREIKKQIAFPWNSFKLVLEGLPDGRAFFSDRVDFPSFGKFVRKVRTP